MDRRTRSDRETADSVCLSPHLVRNRLDHDQLEPTLPKAERLLETVEVLSDNDRFAAGREAIRAVVTYRSE